VSLTKLFPDRASARWRALRASSVITVGLVAVLFFGCSCGLPFDGEAEGREGPPVVVESQFDGQAGGADASLGDSTLFRSEWSTARGSGDVALSDGGVWDNFYCSREQRGRVMAVVPGEVAGWNLTPNVMQITNRGPDNCALVENETAIPDGVDYYVRLYAMVKHESQINFHPVKQAALGVIPAVYWAIQDPVPGVSYRPMFRLLDYSGPEWNAWWPENPLPQGEWFRFEFHVDWIDVQQRRFVVWPRVYDMTGRLLYDATSYRNADIDRSLATSYANGHYGRAPSLDLASRIAVGYEGAVASRVEGGQWYYAAIEIRTDTWPGPFRP